MRTAREKFEAAERLACLTCQQPALHKGAGHACKGRMALADTYALAPLLEVQKGLEELRDKNVGLSPMNASRHSAYLRALRLVNAQIAEVEKLGREEGT
jgi:hypothetical protein